MGKLLELKEVIDDIVQSHMDDILLLISQGKTQLKENLLH